MEEAPNGIYWAVEEGLVWAEGAQNLQNSLGQQGLDSSQFFSGHYTLGMAHYLAQSSNSVIFGAISIAVGAVVYGGYIIYSLVKKNQHQNDLKVQAKEYLRQVIPRMLDVVLDRRGPDAFDDMDRLFEDLWLYFRDLAVLHRHLPQVPFDSDEWAWLHQDQLTKLKAKGFFIEVAYERRREATGRQREMQMAQHRQAMAAQRGSLAVTLESNAAYQRESVQKSELLLKDRAVFDLAIKLDHICLYRTTLQTPQHQFVSARDSLAQSQRNSAQLEAKIAELEATLVRQEKSLEQRTQYRSDLEGQINTLDKKMQEAKQVRERQNQEAITDKMQETYYIQKSNTDMFKEAIENTKSPKDRAFMEQMYEKTKEMEENIKYELQARGRELPWQQKPENKDDKKDLFDD